MVKTRSQRKLEPKSTVNGCATRARKRRKRAQTTGKAPRKKTSKCIDFVSSMPLDIIFEVIRHLAPKDLVALSRTSMAAYRTLYSPDALSIWEAAQSAIGAPDCPSGFSEPQWASLLFGEPVCQQCNAKNAHNFDFGIRRRVCVRCRKQNLVPASKFEKVYPYYGSEVMEMVPYTRRGWTSRHRTRSRAKFFWASDIERIGSEWAVLQRDIHMYVKGARDKATAYRRRQLRNVMSTAWTAIVCDNWLRQVVKESRGGAQ